jgi:adenylate cyclase
MRISWSLKSKFKTVFWITVFWTILSMIQLTYEVALLKEYGFQYRWSTPGNFMTYFMINTLAFVLNGFVAGMIIVFFLQHWIRNRSYIFGLLYGMITYVILFFLLTCIQNYFVVSSIWDGTGAFKEAYIKGLEDYFFSYEFARNFPFWIFVLLGTLITLFVSDKYGPGVFRKFLLGKYFNPKSEQRIFMFLDLKGATTIAEKLGEHLYFQFIQKVIMDVTPILLETRGEVYQYVGDEIVINWSIRNGIKDVNCIRCFQIIKERLNELAPRYEDQFGVVPEFKAGLHVGKAIVGEIGVIKREIAYSGDVLNTTARIQSKCNELGVSLLLSEDMLNQLPRDRFSPKHMGKVQLKGKAETLSLYSL